MSTNYKRAEFVVEAESEYGIARGVERAIKKIETGNPSGRDAIPRHGVTVEWRVVDAVRASDATEGSIVEPEAPSAPPAMPDVSVLDIEEAKGVVGTAASEAELAALEAAEKSGTRVEGGRKGVLDYINRKKDELKAMASRKEAKDDQKAPKEGQEAGSGAKNGSRKSKE